MASALRLIVPRVDQLCDFDLPKKGFAKLIAASAHDSLSETAGCHLLLKISPSACPRSHCTNLLLTFRFEIHTHLGCEIGISRSTSFWRAPVLQGSWTSSGSRLRCRR